MNRDDVGADVTPLERVLSSRGDELAGGTFLGEAFLGTMDDTLLGALGIVVEEVRPDRVVASMPVGPRVHQPYGVLHGGASVALAETVASIGASLLPQGGLQRVVGIEINANHIRSVRSGSVTAVGQPVHQGRSTQVWSIEIRDDAGRLVCVSRCTLAVLD